MTSDDAQSVSPETPPVRRRRRRRRGSWATPIVCILLAVAAGYGIGWPLARSALGPAHPNPYAPLLPPLGEDIRERLLEVFAVGWLFLFGGSIGSFLNVVVYRSPRGKTLLGPSRCPRCNQKIRAQHNIPVFGWLMLRGRCYDCRLPISARYPFVEGLVAAIFLTLAFTELLSGGANLPARPRNHYDGIAWVVFDPQWDLIGIYALHCFTLSIVLSWALIHWDGLRIPYGYLLMVPLAALAITTFFPSTQPLVWNDGLRFTAPLGLKGALTTLLGGFSGFLACCALARLARNSLGPTNEHADVPRQARVPIAEMAVGGALVGMLLGWQSVAAIAALTGFCHFVHTRWKQTGPGDRAWLLAFWMASWCVFLFWRPIVIEFYHLNGSIDWVAHFVALLIGATLTSWTAKPRIPSAATLAPSVPSVGDHSLA